MSLAEIETVDLAWMRHRRDTMREVAAVLQLGISSALGAKDASKLLAEI